MAQYAQIDKIDPDNKYHISAISCTPKGGTYLQHSIGKCNTLSRYEKKYKLIVMDNGGDDLYRLCANKNRVWTEEEVCRMYVDALSLFKAVRLVKASHGKRSAIADDTDNIEASDMDDEEFAECLTHHVNDTTFDDLVDKCFIIQEIGRIKKVTCTDDGVEVQKDVYNVNLTTSIGEIIQLTAWGGHATDIYVS